MEEAEKDHDINLWNLMLRCRDVNLKLNPRKFQFKVKQVTWIGHLLMVVMAVMALAHIQFESRLLRT